MIEIMKDTLPRLSLYEQLSHDAALQVSLLNVYTDILEYALQILRFIRYRSFIRFGIIIATSFRNDLGDCLKRLKMHANDVDQTANSVEIYRAAEMKQELRSKCEQWLCPPNLEELLNRNLDEKMPDTCDWIWTQPVFLRWSNLPDSSPAANRCLRIAGVQGCGKSVLAASFVASKRKSQGRVLFFSFSGTEASRQTFNSLARSLMWQLLCSLDSDEAFGIVQDLISKGPPIASSLSEVLRRLASLATEPMWYVIDGWDECHESVTSVFNHLIHLFEIQPGARGVLLGRPHAIEVLDPAEYKIEITPSLTKSDVDRYVRTAVSNSLYLQDPEISALAFETIKNGAQGMFLWVKLMVGNLSRPSSKAETIKRLHNLPIGLERIYLQIFSSLINSLDRFDLKFLQILIKLTVAARRPLALQEVQHALAMALWVSDSPPDASCSFQDFVVEKLADRIRHVCGSLIHVRNNFVFLSHFSIQEFLTRPVKEWSDDESSIASWLRIDIDEAQHFFAVICLEYLSHADYSPIYIREEQLSDPATHPFLAYASAHLTYHTSHLEVDGQDLYEKIKVFSKSEKFLSWIQNFTMVLLEDGVYHWEARELLSLVFWIEDDGRKEELSQHLGILMVNELQRMHRNLHENWPTSQVSLILDVLERCAQEFQTVEYGSTPSSNDTDASSSASHIQSLDAVQTAIDNITAQSPKWSNALRSNWPTIEKLNAFFSTQRHYNLELPEHAFVNLADALLKDAESLPVFILMAASAFYSANARYDKALDLSQAALTKLGDQDVLVKCIVQSFKGQSEECLSRYTESEQTFRAVAEAAKKIFGPRHKITAFALIDWGLALGSVTDVEDAEKILHEVLQIRKLLYGEEHVSTVITEQRLADVLFRQGRDADAEASFRHTMEIALRLCGLKHDLTLHSMFWYAFLLYKFERYAEAEDLYLRLIEGVKAFYYPQNPTLLFCLSRRADIAFKLEKYAIAEETLCEEMNLRMEKTVVEYDKVVSVMQRLEETLVKLGKDIEGEQILRKAVLMASEHLGKDHDSTISAFVALGNNLHDSEQYEKAAEVRQEVVEREEKKRGSIDSETLRAMYDLAKSLSRNGKQPQDQEDDYYVVEVYEKTLGPKHDLTLLAMENLARRLSGGERYAEAEELLRTITKLKEETLGVEHQSTMISMEALQLLIFKQGRDVESAEGLQSLLEIRKKSLGWDDQATLDILKALELVKASQTEEEAAAEGEE